MGKTKKRLKNELPSSKLDGILTESSFSCLIHPWSKLHGFRKRVNKNPQKIYIPNKRAFHDFRVSERFEAGIVLAGPEVKSVKRGQVSLADSFVRVRENEATLINVYIAPYEQADTRGYDPRRSRKLLLHKGELLTLLGKVAGSNLVVIPTAIYVKHGFIKVELALARGKRLFEKREELRRRDIDRDVARQLRGKL